MKNSISLLLALFMTAPSAFALPESLIKTSYQSVILPFIQTQGDRFSFQTKDGMELSAIRFKNPNSIGTIVVVNGLSETWAKYGEVFYDLYQKGYSIYSYDHRGQGLSPHLSHFNPEINYIHHFSDYIEDLNTFVETVVIPNTHSNEKFFLLGHSMGGAISTAYLSEYKTPFLKAILSAPMLQINTKPYPEAIARTIVAAACTIGLGDRYAIGFKDYDVNAPFAGNIYTGSEDRFWMTSEVYRENPRAQMGGPSNRWIEQSITATHRIRKETGKIEIPFLLFQAENDQLVVAKGENTGCKNAGSLCTKIIEKGSQHEMLMEKDLIRNDVFDHLFQFFQ